MKKQLLSIFAALTITTVMAQTPSPSWTIAQNPQFNQVPIASTRFMDAVDANVVWLSGSDGTGVFNYNWYSTTSNGGASYTSGNILPDTNTWVLSNMEGIDANNAWVCCFKKSTQSQGALFRTTNGGATWTNATATGMYTNTASFGNFVTFLTPQNGIANGDPNGILPLGFEIWTTANGGNNWTKVPAANIPPSLSGEYAITNLYCKDGTTNVWYGTNKGRVFRTTDAGQTWAASYIQPTPTPVTTNSLIDVAFSGPLNGLALVANGAALDLYKSLDGGVTWTNVSPTPGNLPVNYGTNEMSGIPGTTYFASVQNTGNGGGFLSYSLDNGVTWIDWGSVGIDYLTIDFVNAYTAWVGGFQGFPTGNSGIFKYNGVTFNSIFTLPINICKPNSTVTVSPVNTSAGAPPLTFSWSAQPAGVVFASSTSSVPVITFSSTGTYTISLKVTNVNGLPSTSSQIVNVLSCGAPTANFNIPSTVCNNSAFTLTNTSTGVPAPTFTISTSATSGVTVTPVPSTQFVTVKFASPGIYSVTSNVSSISGTNALTQTVNIIDCSPVANFNLYIPLAPDASSLNTTVAKGCADCYTIFATASATNLSTSSNGANTYTWTVAALSSTDVISTGNNSSKSYTFKCPETYTVTLKAANISGTASISKTIDASICTGIVENFLLNNLLVYPNPANEQLNIVLPATSDSYKIKMINIVGSVVYDEKTVKNPKDVITINLVNRTKGIYFLSVESNNERVVKKIVVE